MGAQSSSPVVLLQGLIHVQRHGSSVPKFDAIFKADKIRICCFYEQLMDSGH
jgi:hypothetical protein